MTKTIPLGHVVIGETVTIGGGPNAMPSAGGLQVQSTVSAGAQQQMSAHLASSGAAGMPHAQMGGTAPVGAVIMGGGLQQASHTAGIQQTGVGGTHVGQQGPEYAYEKVQMPKQ